MYHMAQLTRCSVYTGTGDKAYNERVMFLGWFSSRWSGRFILWFGKTGQGSDLWSQGQRCFEGVWNIRSWSDRKAVHMHLRCLQRVVDLSASCEAPIQDRNGHLHMAIGMMAYILSNGCVINALHRTILIFVLSRHTMIKARVDGKSADTMWGQVLSLPLLGSNLTALVNSDSLDNLQYHQIRTIQKPSNMFKYITAF